LQTELCREISGSHGGEYEDDHFMRWWILTSLMMQAVRISETSVIVFQTTQYNIPENSHL
jgi:hypothetical protein